MKAAFTKINITSSLPVRLSGFDCYRYANDILDPIYARLFYFKSTHDILWIQCDLIGIDEKIVHRLRKTLNMDNIIISCTHTHSSIIGTLDLSSAPLLGLESIFGNYNEDYIDTFIKQIVKETKFLQQQVTDCKIKVAKGKVKDLGSDRHDGSYGDEDALCIEVSNKNQKALILRLSCHPTVMNASSSLISADFCGDIEKEMKEYDMVAFVNGSCGDISTRFTRVKCHKGEKERFAKVIVNQIRMFDFYEYKQDMYYYETTFILPCKKVSSLKECQEELEKAKASLNQTKNLSNSQKRVLESQVEGAKMNVIFANSLKDCQSLSLLVGVLVLEDIVIVFTPLELFSKLTNPIKEKNNCEFVGYTNGYYLYMPDKKAYDLKYYESYTSPFDKGSGEKLMENIVKWIEKMI